MEPEEYKYSSSSEDSNFEESVIAQGKANLKRTKKANSEKAAKKRKNELYKPPTAHELNELKEIESLHNSNLFRLQTEELIKETRIKNKHVSSFLQWYKSFEDLLKQLPKMHDVPLNSKIFMASQEINEHILKNGYIDCDQKLSMNFDKPDGFETFGLNQINALPGPTLMININVQIPKCCLNARDFLNNRYFLRRHCYLIYLAMFMKNLKGEFSWEYFKSSRLLPVLKVCFEKVQIRIFASPPHDYFRPTRFLPDVNNVKISNENINEDILKNSPTPFYNAALAHDVTLSTNNKLIEETLKGLPNVQEAIKLVYIWLKQRELEQLNDEIILYLFTYLVINKKINNVMSTHQILRNFWSFITDMDQKQLSLSGQKDSFNVFQETCEFVLLDQTGCYNVFSLIDLNVIHKLQDECVIAVKLLDKGEVNDFHSLFISRCSIELQYDLFLNVKGPFQTVNYKEEDKAKFVGCAELLVVKNICDILKKGLNKRALQIVPYYNDSNSWDYDSVPLKEMSKISFGINLDPRNAFNFLEMGPELNNKEEKDFREFWGHLSSDRRFKDGSICVAVFFNTNTIKEKREIIKTIINWVIKEKLNLEYNVFYDNVEDLLVNKRITASYPMGTNEEGCLEAITKSDELGKKLRGFSMPLSITGIQGISSVYSFSEVFPPIASNFKCGGKITTTIENSIVLKEMKMAFVPRYIQPIECVIQLEHSSKWPKSLEGIRHVKTAFYLELSKLLASRHNILSTVSPKSIDVLFKGFIFRYTLYIPREIGLLKKEFSNDGVIAYKDSTESAEMEKRLGIVPKFVGALRGIHSQYPCYGPSSALVKRWIRSHMIDDHLFPDIVIDLLNASLFLTQTAFMSPSTPQIGFLRFLKFISELQWNVQPVIVNINDEISKETVAEIESKLLQNRNAYPNLYIITPFDNHQSLFTKTAPSKEVLRRIQQLASETLTYVHKMLEQQTLQFKTIFIPNLEGYDLLIYLRPLTNPCRHEQVMDETEKNLKLDAFDQKESNKMPVVGFNPIKLYLTELRNNYGEFASFFCDPHGGSVIGVLWNPKEFKGYNGHKKVNENLVLNRDAIIEDFYILGKDIVKSIK